MGPRLEEQSIIVTGGASGIGRHAALALGAEGANVIVADFELEGATTEGASAIDGSTIPVEDGVQIFKHS